MRMAGMGVTGGAWPPPPPRHISFGYAGGLSPTNLTEQVRAGVRARVGEGERGEGEGEGEGEGDSAGKGQATHA